MRMQRAISTAIKKGRAYGSYLGFVTAIDSSGRTLTVDIGSGTLLTGVCWIDTYTPVVGNYVVLMRVSTHGWWVVGKNSVNPASGAVPVQRSLTLSPTATYTGIRDAAWTWRINAPDEENGQGKLGWGGLLSSVAIYPPLASLLEPNPTITSAKIRIRRIQPGGAGSGGAALVSPRIYGHGYTNGPVGAPVWQTSAWSPTSMAIGGISRVDLPSSWLSAFISGTRRGIGFYSTASADFAYFTPPVLDITYTTPN